MKRVLLDALVVLVIVCILVWPSFILASWLAERGIFGTCREGNCAYGALFVGTPLICAVLSGIVILGWFRLRRSR